MTQRKTAAVVLAAGRGTRMKSDRPKVLHRLAGRPMIAYVLDALAPLAPQRVVVVVGPGMAEVESLVREQMPSAALAVQDRPLGTGHAVLAAREALQDFDGDVVVLCADTPLINPRTVENVLEARAGAPEPAIAVLGMRPEGANEYGRLIIGVDGNLERIVEYRDASPEERALDLCNAGIMAGQRARLFDLLSRVKADNVKGERYLTDIVGLARAEGLRCSVVEGDAAELAGINSRIDLAEAEAAMQTRLRTDAMAGGTTLRDPGSVYMSFDTRLGRDVVVGPHVVFGPGVRVADGAEIRAFCSLEGASVGRGAIVGPSARLRPGTEIGDEARVGNYVEIKNAVVEAGAKVNHLSYVGDARVGAGANIGAGTITCNFDGFSKAHTEIGPGAFIGSNTALVAPVRIGEGAIVGAGSVITHDVADNALAVSRASQSGREGGARRFRERRRAGGDEAETATAAPGSPKRKR